VIKSQASTDQPNRGESCDLACSNEDGETLAGQRDFVAFEMLGDTFAFPMECVREIIRMPQLVKVPLGPRVLEGLAELHGRMLPVISFRSCCQLARAEPDDGTRVVVVEASGVTLGFIVDRVVAVTTLDVTEIEGVDSLQATVRSDLLTAVLKGQDGRMIAVLDVQGLVASELPIMTGTASRAQPCGPRPAFHDGLPQSQDTIELVSFWLGAQEYALPVDRVQEILPAPEQIIAIPHADARVVGVMNLRDGLLPVISLRQIFGLPDTDLAPTNRIIVMTLHQGSRTSLVGLILDSVREVLRVPVGLIDELPQSFDGGSRRSEVRSICRLEAGRRLVCVLSADALMNLEDLDAAVRDIDGVHRDPVGDTVAGMDVGVEVEVGNESRFLVVRLAGEEYCIDVDTVQEIIRVPDLVTQIPGTPDLVERLVNLRGSVLPLVDLRNKLGFPLPEHDQRQRIAVLIINGVRTGFVVDSVVEVLTVAARDIEVAPELSAEQVKMVTRIVNLVEQNRILFVLETGQLITTDHLATRKVS
jgi:purine-binding chemotaxis protein CheW